VWRDREVPPVLLSGDHAAIARWRRDEALRRTAAFRPDLVARLPAGTLDNQDRAVLLDAGFPVSAKDMAH
jgi:tRNA (guanine37-N1)-methyltransferase